MAKRYTAVVTITFEVEFSIDDGLCPEYAALDTVRSNWPYCPYWEELTDVNIDEPVEIGRDLSNG